jgi:hypothetical protein
MRTENKILIFGLFLMSIGIVFAIAYGSVYPSTTNLNSIVLKADLVQNATNMMLNGDNWDCGYVVNMTKLNVSTIQDCFR